VTFVLAIFFACISFVLSAAAGMGGSLILVPVLSLLLGAKQGIALSALLLASNNVAKIVAYRHTIPIRAASGLLLLTVAGSALGARLLVAAPERLVQVAIVTSISLAFLLEQVRLDGIRLATSPFGAFFAGATSGFSGTSGPLKGLALRSLSLDRLHFIGAASAISLAGDLMKTVMYTEASLLDRNSLAIALLAVPLMPLATFAGRQFNLRISERVFARMFWTIMAGYSLRLILG
jgi:uncharacterized protein